MRWLLHIALFLFGMLVKAQPYVPLLDSVNVWNHGYHGWYVSQNPTPASWSPFENTRYFTDRDTTIDSLIYKFLILSDPPPTVYPDYHAGFIREDTSAKKVYYRTAADTAERLIYDFSLGVGDSVFIDFVFSPNNCFPDEDAYFQVISIQLRNTTSGLKREFILEPHFQSCTWGNSSYYLRWVEGIGCLSDFLYINPMNFAISPGLWAVTDLWLCGIDVPQYEFLYFLTCFDHNYKVYFDTCAYTIASYQSNPPLCNFPVFWGDSCAYGGFCGGNVEELSSISEIKVFPIPSTQNINIEVLSLTSIDCDLIIRDIKGSIVYERSKKKLLPGKNLILIEIPQLNQGYYTLTIEEPNGMPVTLKLLIQ
ncbi:MAG: hypothetical protein IT233_00755 [Bacteroidia bacterium]|nr:hypothetical protein [Bacteroidia bacterium]